MPSVSRVEISFRAIVIAHSPYSLHSAHRRHLLLRLGSVGAVGHWIRRHVQVWVSFERDQRAHKHFRLFSACGGTETEISRHLQIFEIFSSYFLPVIIITVLDLKVGSRIRIISNTSGFRWLCAGLGLSPRVPNAVWSRPSTNWVSTPKDVLVGYHITYQPYSTLFSSRIQHEEVLDCERDNQHIAIQRRVDGIEFHEVRVD